MSRKLSLLLFIIIFVLLFTATIQAQSFFNARAYGMGGAYTAIADDYSAFYYNPAGLAHAGFLGFGLGLSGGIRANNISDFIDSLMIIIDSDQSWADRLDELGSVGVNGQLGGMGGLRFGPFAAGVTFLGEGVIATEGIDEVDANFFTTINLAYAYSITEPFANIGALSVGANLKYVNSLYIEQGEDEVVANDFACDLGLLIRLTDYINLGIKIENLFSTNNIEHNPLLRSYTVGAGIRLPLVGLMAVADVGNIPEKNGETFFKFGLEQRLLFNLIALRAGIAQIGADNRHYTGGIGINIGPFKGDFSMGTDSLTLQNLSAALGLRIDF